MSITRSNSSSVASAKAFGNGRAGIVHKDVEPAESCHSLSTAAATAPASVASAELRSPFGQCVQLLDHSGSPPSHPSHT